MARLLKILEGTAWIAIGGWVLYWVLQATTFCSFHTPTQSMTPTILPGDYGIVGKWKLGPRIFDIRKVYKGEPVEIHRLPGYGKIDRNDIVVFNNPRPKRDSVGIDWRKYYCKRAVAIPGDTLYIRNCKYEVAGTDLELGRPEAQGALASMMKNPRLDDVELYTRTWPYDSVMDWSISDFGPLFIPAKGSTVKMTRENTLLYGDYIAWEQHSARPEWKEGEAWINGNPLPSYTFLENYYFCAGDNVANSSDSRYWGLVPEPMMVGVASFIWNSENPRTGRRRWNRIGTLL